MGLLVACKPQPDDPSYAPRRPMQPLQTAQGDGGIYQEGFAVSLFEDYKARRVGDILTVILNEETDGEKEATTEIIKDNTTTINNPTLFGTTPQFNVPGIVPLVTNRDRNLNFNLSGNRDFNGEAESIQNNRLTGTISVVVSEVLPNGNLVIRGEKWITINTGEEFIRISGIVRPADIGSDNTISSLRVANARIAYSGTGEVADSNVMGWLSKFFLSPYFLF